MSDRIKHPAAIPLKEAAAEFLHLRRIAVTGVSRHAGNHGANVVYLRLRDRGYEVFAVNPHADTVEGDPAYANIASIPGGVDGVVVATSPEYADATVQECIETGVRHVWMHHGPGGTSVSSRAVAAGRASGIRVIDGGCPLMFDPQSDVGHRCMRVVFTAIGRLPRLV